MLVLALNENISSVPSKIYFCSHFVVNVVNGRPHAHDAGDHEEHQVAQKKVMVAPQGWRQNFIRVTTNVQRKCYGRKYGD
jgi:hypothetical protein